VHFLTVAIDMTDMIGRVYFGCGVGRDNSVFQHQGKKKPTYKEKKPPPLPLSIFAPFEPTLSTEAIQKITVYKVIPPR
jgi:hypothetical protein